jgi:hypothetical protein
VRVTKNPSWYKLPAALNREQIEVKLQEMCMRGLNALADIKLINLDDYDIRPADGGKLMAR